MIALGPRLSLNKLITLICVFVATFILYLPAAHGPYLLDDYPNLLQNESLILDHIDSESLLEAATSSPASFLGRPLSMLSFALNYTLAGDKDPFPVKLVNIVLHLLTGIGIFTLLILLLSRWTIQENDSIYWTSLLTTTLWLIHPLQISTVLYAVQRMTILSALFTVIGLIAYLKYRQITLDKNSGYMKLFTSVGAATVLGILSKENAVLLPVLALLIELAVFRFGFHPLTSRFNKLVVQTLLLAPVFLILSYLIYTYFLVRGEVIWPYSFTIDQRLLTEARVLMHYLGWISLLNPEPMSMLHTDLELSTGFLQPVTTLVSLIILVLLIVLSVLSLQDRRYIIISFGVLWFFTGHLLESTTIPLELMFEHRNYLPALGILLIPCWYLVNFTRPPARVYYCLILILLTLFLSHERISIWRNEKSYTLDLIKNKGDVSWAWAEVASYLNRTGNHMHAIEAARTAANLEQNEPAFIFGEANIRCQHLPDSEFPEDFRVLLSSALTDNRITPTTVNTFVSMVRVCQQTTVNDALLEKLYIEAGNNGMSVLAEVGKQAVANLKAKTGRN